MDSAVRVPDYSELFDPDDPAYHVADDGHPTPEADHILAARLAADLDGS